MRKPGTRKKALVCGATGFIGRNVAEALAGSGEYEVYGTFRASPPLSHPGIRMVRADLRQPEEVERVMAGMDIVVQAAATTSGARDILARPYIHVTDNAVMNSLLLRSAFEHQVSGFLFFSCAIMYPSSDKPLGEKDFDANAGMYGPYFGAGWTKIYVEKMCEFYSRIGRTKFTVVRHSNIYGPHDKFDLDRSHVFGATVTKVMRARDGDALTVWGAGEEERDLLYVSDLVEFIRLALENQESQFELYTVGSGRSIPVKTLVRRIIESSGKRIVVEHDLSRPSLRTKVSLDSTKARERLGWVPKVSLEEGIRKTLEWHRENIR